MFSSGYEPCKQCKGTKDQANAVLLRPQCFCSSSTFVFYYVHSHELIDKADYLIGGHARQNPWTCKGDDGGTYPKIIARRRTPRRTRTLQDGALQRATICPQDLDAPCLDSHSTKRKAARNYLSRGRYEREIKVKADEQNTCCILLAARQDRSL